jgi:release factor glutamine methyltransferase
MPSNGKNMRSLLTAGWKVLEENGVPNARRNAEWLMMSVVGGTILDLIIKSEQSLTALEEARFLSHIERRAAREPLQYIVGDTAFMSFPFRLAPGVFIPRPDTERLVEVTAQLLAEGDGPGRILDLCCGSGVIAVSLAAAFPDAQVIGVDSNPQAVLWAGINADLNELAARTEFVQAAAADFVVTEADRFDAVVCNPPYIPSGQIGDLPPEVRDYEPVDALDGGREGLDFYGLLIPRLEIWLRPGGLAAFEIGAEQALPVSNLMRNASFEKLETHQDYQQLDRVVTGCLPA